MLCFYSELCLYLVVRGLGRDLVQVDFDLNEWPQLWSDDERCLARKSLLQATAPLLPGLASAGSVGAYVALTFLQGFFMRNLSTLAYSCSQISPKKVP